MIVRRNRVRTKTPSREAVRDVCREATGGGPPHGTATSEPYPGEPIRNRPKRPLVDAPRSKSTSLDVFFEEIEPVSFPAPHGPGGDGADLAGVSLPEGRRVLTGRDATIGEIFRQYGGPYLKQHGKRLSDEQKRVLQELTLCRT